MFSPDYRENADENMEMDEISENKRTWQKKKPKRQTKQNNKPRGTCRRTHQAKDYKVVDVAVIWMCLAEGYAYNLWTLYLV